MAAQDEMQWHPAANIFPMLGETELNELADDIKKHGQQEPIILLSGMVLDGRNRWLACKMRGIKPNTAVAREKIDDPVSFVLSRNLHRRHLTPSQKSMCAARARDVYEKQAKERMQAGGGDKKSGVENLPPPIENTSKARDAAGKAFGVSGKSVDHAKRVIEKGIPELAKAVDEGRMAVSTAAILATEPEETQKAEVDSPKRNRDYKPAAKTKVHLCPQEAEPENHGVRGVGVRRAHEAIGCLKKIPKNDALRKRAFEIVSDYIQFNR